MNGPSKSVLRVAAVRDKCYLLSMPREIRDLIWKEMFLRDYAFNFAPKDQKRGAYIYCGSEECSPFSPAGQQDWVRSTDDVFDRELIVVDHVREFSSTAVRLDQKKRDPAQRAIIGTEALQTCKQICEEGVHILYGMNAFQLIDYQNVRDMKCWREWMQPIRCKGGNTMWSIETLAAFSSQLAPKYWRTTYSLHHFKKLAQTVGKNNAARITMIEYKIILTSTGSNPYPDYSWDVYEATELVKNYDKMFNETFSGLKDLRMACYWDPFLGKDEIQRNVLWYHSPNYRFHEQKPNDHLSSQWFFRLTKNAETFVQRAPDDMQRRKFSATSIPAQPRLWTDVMDLRGKNNQKRAIADIS